MPRNRKTPTCDYCGKTSSQVDMLVEGPVADKEINGRESGTRSYICSGCIDTLQGMVRQRMKLPTVDFLPISIPSPKQIVEILDKSIIGQNGAKKALAVAVVNHYKRLQSFTSKNDFDISNNDYCHCILFITHVIKVIIINFIFVNNLVNRLYAQKK